MENKKNNTVVYTDYIGNQVKLNTSIIKQYLTKGNATITDQEAMNFLMLCKNRGLNPFVGEAHLIKYGQNTPATMVVGKDAFTQRAAGHNDFNGMRAGIIVEGENGIERREGSMRLSNETLVGGWADVYRKSWEHPIKAEVSYGEYEGKTRDGNPNSTWSKMGATMIRKVALVQALREAFPDQFGGLYDSAEMSQTTNMIDLDKIVTEQSPVKTENPKETINDEVIDLTDQKTT